MATWTANFRLRGGGRPSIFLRQVSHYLVRYATWIPALIWFNSYVAEVTFIRGPSMYPFFNPQHNESLRKDLCLVWKLYAQEGLRRGMVVVFRYLLPLLSSWFVVVLCGCLVVWVGLLTGHQESV
jgi:inner membrane protease subunit 2